MRLYTNQFSVNGSIWRLRDFCSARRNETYQYVCVFYSTSDAVLHSGSHRCLFPWTFQKINSSTPKNT
ncbi:unnamed protein product [Cylicocyclus nassatus]|uniref:Uncharacterized protein n=1 Tax=Cylicocyclus nassatus TaxID=53992 RepID=A0AA36GLN9_CYLNA|nr:unnamed protein product [Cylicocyclus nassatus]